MTIIKKIFLISIVFLLFGCVELVDAYIDSKKPNRKEINYKSSSTEDTDFKIKQKYESGKKEACKNDEQCKEFYNL